MNQIVQRMKTALTDYYNKAKEISRKADQINKELLPEIAQKRLEPLYQDLNTVRYNAKQQIKSAGAEGRLAAEKWATLNGADLTDDAKILQAGLTLTQTDFDDLCIRYKNNGSMSRLLAEYAEKQNQRVIPDENADLKTILDTKNLMTVDKKLDQWNRLESSAQMILRAIDGSGIAQGIDDYAVTFSVENFGDNIEV